MPQADLKYSADLEIEPVELLARIEAIIDEHDSGAGACKGRAYPTAEYHHSHLLLDIAVLSKPHRNDEWANALLGKLEHALAQYIPKPCHVAVGIGFLSPYYRSKPPK